MPTPQMHPGGSMQLLPRSFPVRNHNSPRRASLFALTVAIALSGVGCNGFPRSNRDPAIAAILRTHVVTAAYIASPPHFVVSPTGDKSGIMADLVHLAAKRLGDRVKYAEAANWSTLERVANDGRTDIVVSGIWPTRQRAQNILFSRPIYYTLYFAFVRIGDHRFDNNLGAIDSANVRIATASHDISSEIAAGKFRNASRLRLSSSGEGGRLMESVANKRADVTFVDGVRAAQYLHSNPAIALRKVVGVSAVMSIPNTVVFGRSEFVTRALFDNAFARLRDDGSVLRTLRRYDVDDDVSLSSDLSSARVRDKCNCPHNPAAPSHKGR
jgi:ABC-type amino acid transport substrate-binding protein